MGGFQWRTWCLSAPNKSIRCPPVIFVYRLYRLATCRSTVFRPHTTWQSRHETRRGPKSHATIHDGVLSCPINSQRLLSSQSETRIVAHDSTCTPQPQGSDGVGLHQCLAALDRIQCNTTAGPVGTTAGTVGTTAGTVGRSNTRVEGRDLGDTRDLCYCGRHRKLFERRSTNAPRPSR